MQLPSLTFSEAWDQIVQILSHWIKLFFFISRFHLQLFGDGFDGLLIVRVNKAVKSDQ